MLVLGAVMPFIASEQSLMACLCLSAGVMVGCISVTKLFTVGGLDVASVCAIVLR